jgi:copper chaperone CopZ
MKTILVSMTMAFALALSVRADDVSVKITDVHLCCDSCVKGAKAAVGKVPGATATVDKDEGTVSLMGPDKATVQKAADALVAAGYFGKSSDASIKINDSTGAKGEKVQSLKIEGLHLCCGKCVKTVNETLGMVSGVKANTATKGAKSFEITGDFNDKEAMTALQKAGLTGQVGK